jgi:hypothetical protein
MRRKFRRLKLRLWYALFIWVINHVPMVRTASIANRTVYSGFYGHLEFDITIKDNREADGWSREEVIKLLTRVRREEIRMKWTCPEPKFTVFDI